MCDGEVNEWDKVVYIEKSQKPTPINSIHRGNGTPQNTAEVHSFDVNQKGQKIICFFLGKNSWGQGIEVAVDEVNQWLKGETGVNEWRIGTK